MEEHTEPLGAPMLPRAAARGGGGRCGGPRNPGVPGSRPAQAIRGGSQGGGGREGTPGAQGGFAGWASLRRTPGGLAGGPGSWGRGHGARQGKGGRQGTRGGGGRRGMGGGCVVLGLGLALSFSVRKDHPGSSRDLTSASLGSCFPQVLWGRRLPGLPQRPGRESAPEVRVNRNPGKPTGIGH